MKIRAKVAARANKIVMRASRIHQCGCERAARSFEGEDARRQDCEAHEAHRRFVAAEGDQAWDQTGPSSLGPLLIDTNGMKVPLTDVGHPRE